MVKDDEQEQEQVTTVTDIEALKENAAAAVYEFADRYIPMPRFTEDCEVMDQGQLRDAMGLRATMDSGDPWPKAEETMLKLGFRWHMLGGMRVMYLRERENSNLDDGWLDAEELEEEIKRPNLLDAEELEEN